MLKADITGLEGREALGRIFGFGRQVHSSSRDSVRLLIAAGPQGGT